MPTWNRLDLETLRFGLIVPKSLSEPMIGENRQLVTNKLVEFEQ